jgi:hypothetical protein
MTVAFRDHFCFILSIRPKNDTTRLNSLSSTHAGVVIVTQYALLEKNLGTKPHQTIALAAPIMKPKYKGNA